MDSMKFEVDNVECFSLEDICYRSDKNHDVEYHLDRINLRVEKSPLIIETDTNYM